MKIELFGDITSWSWWGNACNLDTIKSIVEANPKDTQIDLLIHSDGGEVLEGLAMYDYLRTSGKTITSTLMGGAHSAAIILLLAGEKGKRFCTANNTSFLHNVQTCAGGSPHDLASALIDGLTLEERIVSIYSDRTGITREKAQEILDSSRLYSAKEMKELGFVDEIINYNTNFLHKKYNMDVKELLQAALNCIKANNKTLDKVVNYDYKDGEGKLLFSTASEEDTLAQGDEVSMAEGVSGDGTYTLVDGRTVALANAKVTSITPASTGEYPPKKEGEEGEEPAKKGDEEDPEKEKLKEDNALLKTSLDKANELIKELRSALASNYKAPDTGYSPPPKSNNYEAGSVEDIKARLAKLNQK